ncbi:MAG: recombinase family protein [Gammaproteobacteria bacterium]
MTQVAIYARYSTDMQRDASIEDQIRVCQERADNEGWKTYNCYTDHGQSGATMLRPGIQMLLQDALAGRFSIIIAEALDRLSRDQEDIAGIYKRLTFAGVKILTLAEGEVNDLHIGLKGTMNALFLKDLANKTRRGLRGRVEAGKSGGGNAYGYDVVRKFTETGEAIRGDRSINKTEASIVNRIFNEYADGFSPRAIAKKLNAEKIAGPTGKAWGPSTIHGNRQRGTGILNNELYIGRLVWNRLRYIKDPETGKRVSRLNDESEWITHEVPDLRIVEQDAWDRVKARQGTLKASVRSSSKQSKGEAGYWDRRRPRYLFSGLIKCGACGGGVVNVNTHRVGCAAARSKGTCDNTRTLKRDEMEATILSGLKNHLMEPELFAVFCDEYTRHLNKLRMDHNAARHGIAARLAKIDRELDKLVEAICEGIPAAKVKDKMWALENEKAELEGSLADTTEEPVLIHPNMAEVYRKQVTSLHASLNDENRRAEAVDIVRSLVEKIVLTPASVEGKNTLAIDLHGHLAGILSLAAQTKKPLGESDFSVRSTKLVAGGRYRLYLLLVANELPTVWTQSNLYPT